MTGTERLAASIAQLRCLYLHALHGGTVTANDLSTVIMSLEIASFMVPTDDALRAMQPMGAIPSDEELARGRPWFFGELAWVTHKIATKGRKILSVN